MTYSVDPVLQAVAAQGVDLLTAALGCRPFIEVGSGGQVVVGFDAVWFDKSDWWWWVVAHGCISGCEFLDGPNIGINPRCWDAALDWGPVLAHEFGHSLGWTDLDGHPYMTVALQPGWHYRDDLVMVCGDS